MNLLCPIEFDTKVHYLMLLEKIKKLSIIHQK